MFNLSGKFRVHLGLFPIDGRWGFDRLALKCKSVIKQDPYSGDLFLFFNRRKTRIRLIFYDMQTSYLLSGRLEIGTFKINWDPKRRHVELRKSDLITLLSGGELSRNVLGLSSGEVAPENVP